MPELPEVECVRRSLLELRPRGQVRGIERSSFELRVGRGWSRAEEKLSRLRGAEIVDVLRRGKYLLVVHEGTRHAKRPTLLVHLGMSGVLEVVAPGEPRRAHTHLVLDYEGGAQLRFSDPRRFGGLKVDAQERLEQSAILAGLGPEPLSDAFDGEVLRRKLGGTDRVLRDALLDQRVVAGVGNIYALEALFVARLHPLLSTGRLKATAFERLAVAIQSVLEAAITRGGTTLRDYRDARGQQGGNQAHLFVYGRAGEPCSACGSTLEGFVHGGRGGVFCPRDQRQPRGRFVD